MKISLSIKGIDGLKLLKAKIDKYPTIAAHVGVEAINDVAETVITRASADISGRYNLQAAYVREKFRIQRANSIGGTAVVGARKRGVRLARYDAEQLTKAAPKAKGDQRRSISAGNKQAGVSVQVLRAGSRKAMQRAFLIPLRAGTNDGGNGMGIFIRDEFGNVKHLYGRSPDQAYRAWLKERESDINALLVRSFSKRLTAAIRKA